MDKITLVQAIHDLKTSFRKRFGDSKPITPEIENIINLAARQVKKGYIAEWYEEQGIKVRLTKMRRWREVPATNHYDGKSPNPIVRKRK